MCLETLSDLQLDCLEIGARKQMDELLINTQQLCDKMPVDVISLSIHRDFRARERGINELEDICCNVRKERYRRYPAN